LQGQRLTDLNIQLGQPPELHRELHDDAEQIIKLTDHADMRIWIGWG
jgi:hypothetical protein